LPSGDEEASTSGRGKLISSVVTVGGLVILIAGGALFQDQIRNFLTYFSSIVDDLGPVGVILYFFVYAGLEARPCCDLRLTTCNTSRQSSLLMLLRG
jgi:hypothetical protein